MRLKSLTNQLDVFICIEADRVISESLLKMLFLIKKF